MTRHRTDMVSLLFGLAFFAVGAAFIVYELTDTNIDGSWLGAFVFVTLGLVALAATLFRRLDDDAPEVEADATTFEPRRHPTRRSRPS